MNTLNLTIDRDPYGDVDEDHKSRALAAAREVFNAAEVDPEKAQTEFRKQLVEHGDADQLTGEALVWWEADLAANRALTEGWNDPEGTSCSIFC